MKNELENILRNTPSGCLEFEGYSFSLVDDVLFVMKKHPRTTPWPFSWQAGDFEWREVNYGIERDEAIRRCVESQ